MAQCPEFYNGAGVASSNPYWIGCSGGNYTIFVQPTLAITGGYVINWGDGTANYTGVNLIPPSFISHTYTATIDTFPVIITTTSPACTISGVVVMEQTPSASIQIPFGNAVYGCTPASFNFLNASTNISETTQFTWTFGDGSAAQIFNSSNLGQILNHTYLPGTTSCNVAVTLSAENYCNRGNPSTNVYQPIQVWDRDNVIITPDALIKCSPSTTFHFDNTTGLNCIGLGNNQQRYEYWNFGNYWGLGHDSIIVWQPFSPPNRAGYDITYPGIGTYDILLKDSSFCGLDTATISVRVIAPPVANLSLSTDSICEGQSLTATNLSTGTADQFIWDFGDGSVTIIVSNTAAQTYVYSDAGSYTVTLIANIAGASGCTSTATKQIIVKPSPTADFNFGSNNFCDTGEETFVNTSSGAISSYSWNFDNGNTSALPSPLPETYTGAGSYNVLLNVTGTNGCIANKTKQVTVFQSPNAEIIPFSACKGTSGILTDASTSAIGDPIISWSWDFGDFSAISNAQNPSHIFPDSGIYNVVLTVSTAFCNNKDSIYASVNPLPVSNYLQSAASGCTPLLNSFTNQSTEATSYTWDFGDGTPTSTAQDPNHTFTNPQPYDTTYTVSLIAISSFGCKDTFSTTITVFHAAHASFTSNYLINCSPLPVQFTNTSSGSTAYSWDFGDSSAVSTSASPLHTFNNNSSFLQTYITTLTVNSPNGCSGSATQNIMVYPRANFSFIGLPTDTGCSALSVNFTGSSGGAIYQWNFGDGTTSLVQSPNHLFTNVGISDSLYHVVLMTTSPFSCKDTTDLYVLVHPIPTALFSQSISVGCSPLTVSFADNSILANTSLWDFGDNTSSTALNPTHTFTNNTAATIIYNVIQQVKTSAGCTDTMIRQVEVFPKVTATFTSPPNACSPLSCVITNASINATTYSWDFGDGGLSGQTNPSHLYTNPSTSDITYTITLTAQSSFGCVDAVSYPITIFYKPNAIFSLSSNAGCPPFLVNFNNSSIGASTNDWTFGDGSSINGVINPSHTYWDSTTNSITNIAELIVTTTNSCSDTMSSPVIVYPDVTAAFSCPAFGCSPYTVAFTNQSVNTTNYLWDFGNGSFSGQSSPTNTYINSTTSDQVFTIQLIASSNLGCADTATNTTIVAFQPLAGFTATPITQTYPSAQVDVINTTNAGTWDYSWSWGDSNSSTLQNPAANIYATWGTYTITLIVNSINCADTAFHSITILPPLPIASFNIPPYDGCEPEKICFVNNSQYSISDTWEFGDGNTSNSQNPCYTYFSPGLFLVTLTVTGPGGQTDVADTTVTIYPKPQANFSATPLLVQIPNTQAQFFNLSTDADSYLWNFGDGGTSIAEDPIHAYTQVGQYDIILIATNQYGCTDSLTKFQYITAEQVNDIILPNAFTPNPAGSNGGVYDPTSFNNDVFFPFTVNGVDEYRLTIYNKWGEIIFDTSDLKTGWDGFYKGKLCESDVYIWKVAGKYLDGVTYLKFGDVTLLR